MGIAAKFTTETSFYIKV